MENRWIALLAAGGLMWSLNFYYDLPASLSTPLQMHLGYSDEEYAYIFSAFYIAYSAPNIVLPFISGFAVQRYGERRIWLLCLSSLILGELIFALGIQVKESIFLVGGRLLLGFGGETLAVLASELVTRCFQNNKLALALAGFMMIGTLGTIANSFITPRLAHATGVSKAAWLTSISCVTVAVFSATKIFGMDFKASESHKASNVNVVAILKRMPPQYWQLCIICFLIAGCISPFNNSAQQFLATTFYDGDETVAGSVVGLTHIISGCLILPFGWLLEQPRFKKTPIALGISSAVLLTAHSVFLLQVFSPIIPVSLLGVANGLFGTAFWPCVATIILKHALPVPGRYELLHQQADSTSTHEMVGFPQDSDITGRDSESNDDVDDEESGRSKSNEDLLVVAYGIMTSLLNLSVAVMPAILAVMRSMAGFTGIETVFVALSIAGIFASVKLFGMWK